MEKPANIDKSDMSLKETHSLFGELARQARLYLKLEEGVGIALQAEHDQAANQKTVDRLKVERQKAEAEYKEFIAKIASEKEKLQFELNDLKSTAEKTKKENADSADKDTQVNSNRAASLREEIGKLTKQRDGMLAEIPSARARAEAEIEGHRKKVVGEKHKIDNELFDSQNKLKAFKTNIAGLSN